MHQKLMTLLRNREKSDQREKFLSWFLARFLSWFQTLVRTAGKQNPFENVLEIGKFWFLGPKIFRKNVQKVTHFYEFSATKNASLFGYPLYMVSYNHFCKYITCIWITSLSAFDIFKTFERKFEHTGFANLYITMSWNESNFVTQADINIYEERMTLNQKMRTKLTLEQKRCILDVIERLNYYLKRKAENFYRYDVWRVC